MAEDLRALLIYPAFHNFNAGDAETTEIKLPSACSRITLGGVTKAIYIAQNGATDGGAVPTNRGFVPKSNYLTLQIGKGKNRANSIFVSSQSGSAEISIILEE